MSAVLLLTCDEQIANKAKYVFDTFLHVLGIPYLEESAAFDPGSMLIGYGELTDAVRSKFQDTGGVLMHASPKGPEFFKARADFSVQDVAYVMWKGKQVPVLFTHPSAPRGGTDLEGLLARPARNSVCELSHDIILSAFYFLSRWEETVIETRDQHGRFRYKNSLAAKLGFPGNIVDEYLDIFLAILNQVRSSRGLSELQIPLWDGRKEFVVCLTHDVDHVHKSVPSRLKFVWDHTTHPYAVFQGEGFWQRLSYALQTLLGREDHDPRWTFPAIMAMENDFGFTSSFYFQAVRRGAIGCDYDVSEARIKNLIHELVAAGCEIGLHGTYSSVDTPELFLQEKERLEKSTGRQVIGHRQHYLRMDCEKTMPIYEQAGLLYDATLGYAEKEGYRNEFSYPYHPYDCHDDKPFCYWELPLALMDGTLLSYRNSDLAQAWQVIQSLLEQARDRRGCMVVVWHNQAFFDGEFPGYTDLYFKMLGWIRDNKGIGLSGKEVLRMWEARRNA
jgi:hypothetical protein